MKNIISKIYQFLTGRKQKPSVALYARFSDETQAESIIKRQVEDLEKLLT